MSTLNQQLFGRDLEADTARNFLVKMQAAADVALTPARQLQPMTLRPRNIAVKLANDFAQVDTLLESVFTMRTQVESDTTKRPQVLRDAWSVFAQAATAEVATLETSIRVEANELRASLQDLALPVSSDPAAALLARQDITVRLGSPDRGVLGGTTPFALFMELAQRGGDTAAAVASAWGRDTYVTENGSDSSYDLVVKAALATAVNSEDPARRAAGAALAALDSRVGSPPTEALYTAGLFAQQVLRRVQEIVSRSPVIASSEGVTRRY